MAKKYSLTISERIAAVKIFDEFKGSISQLSQILEDVKQLAITEAEWTKAGLKKTPTDDEIKNLTKEEKEKVSQVWNWKDEGNEKDVPFGEESLKYLRDKIKSKSEAGEVTLADKALITLSEKIA
ncbi:MAG: hypothetical protein KGJ90_06660 [Patescibacteria group bacterium]|nr:hypothetical protein [Patescibacteria group bacterium]